MNTGRRGRRRAADRHQDDELCEARAGDERRITAFRSDSHLAAGDHLRSAARERVRLRRERDEPRAEGEESPGQGREGGQKILTQNEANCGELSRILANFRQF